MEKIPGLEGEFDPTKKWGDYSDSDQSGEEETLIDDERKTLEEPFLESEPILSALMHFRADAPVIIKRAPERAMMPWPFSVNLNEPDPLLPPRTGRIVEEAASYELLQSQKDRVLRGGFFFAAEVGFREGVEYLFGEQATDFLALFRRGFFKKNPPVMCGGGIVMPVPMVDWRFPRERYSSIHGDEVPDLAFEVSQELDTIEKRESFSQKIRALGAKMSSGIRVPWKRGQCLKMNFVMQKRYLLDFQHGFSAIMQINKAYPMERPKLLLIAQAWIEGFINQTENYTPLVESLIKEHSLGARSHAVNNDKDFILSAIGSSLVRDLSSIMALTKPDFMTKKEQQRQGIEPIQVESSPLNDIGQIICSFYNKTPAQLIAATWLTIYCQVEPRLDRTKEEEDHIWRNWGAGQKPPTVIMGSHTGAAPNNTRSQGGQNDVLHRVLEAGKLTGEINPISLMSDSEISHLLVGLSLKEREEKLEELMREEFRFLAAKAVSRDREPSIFLAQNLVDKLGKVRFIALESLAWGTESLALYLRRFLQPFTTFRGKGRFNIAPAWKESVENRLLNEHGVVIKAETDLVNSTFLARKEIPITMLDGLRQAFPMPLDEWKLLASGWEKMEEGAVILQRKEGAPPESRESEIGGQVIQPRFLNQREMGGYIDLAGELLKEFSEEGNASAAHIAMAELMTDAFIRNNSEVVCIKVPPGSGKTMTAILLSIILASISEGGSIYISLTTRDSVNSVAESLGAGLSFSTFEDEIPAIMITRLGSILERLEIFLSIRGYEVERPGFWHRWIRGEQRWGRVIISTPSSMLVAADLTSQDIVIVDEVNTNLLLNDFVRGRGIPPILMSANPPIGICTERNLLVAPGKRFFPEVAGGIAQALATLFTYNLKPGGRILVINLSKKKAEEAERTFYEMNPPAGFFVVRTSGDDPRNREKLAVHDDYDTVIIFTTRQVSRSDSDFDLVIFPDAERKVLKSCTGWPFLTFGEIDAGEVQQLAARSSRKRTGFITDQKGRAVSSILYHVEKEQKVLHFEETPLEVIAMNLVRSGLSRSMTSFMLTRWQAGLLDWIVEDLLEERKIEQQRREKFVGRIDEEGAPKTQRVDRSTEWGNPIKIEKGVSREKAIKAYKLFALDFRREAFREKARNELNDKKLLCNCFPEACHCDLLSAIAADDTYLYEGPIQRAETLEIVLRNLAQVSVQEGKYEASELTKFNADTLEAIVPYLTTLSIGEEWEDLRAVEDAYDGFFQEPLGTEEFSILARKFPSKVGILQNGILTNLAGYVDIVSPHPPYSGTWFCVELFRKAEWKLVEDFKYREAVSLTPVRSFLVEKRKHGKKKGWEMTLAEGGSILQGKKIEDSIINSKLQNWGENLDLYDQVAVQKDGWFLSSVHSAALLEALMTQSIIIKSVILRNRRLMEIIRESIPIEYDKSGIDANFLNALYDGVQSILGGRINKLKSSFGLLLARPLADTKEDVAKTTVLSANTGDDSGEIILTNLPTRWFTNEKSFLGQTTCTIARKLIYMKAEMSGSEVRWVIEEINRKIPKLFRALTCMSKTIGYAPTQSQDRIHPLLVLKNFLKEEARAYWPQIKDFLLSFDGIDLSLFWEWAGELPSAGIISEYFHSPMDIQGLEEMSQMRVRRSGGREALIAEGLVCRRTSQKIATQWKLRCDQLLGESFRNPQPRIESQYVPAEVLENLRKKAVLQPSKYRPTSQIEVPITFIEETFRKEIARGNMIGFHEERFARLPIYRLLKSAGRAEEAAEALFMKFDVSLEEAQQFMQTY